MNENPYRSQTALSADNTSPAPLRWYGLGLSVLSAIFALIFGWQALVMYAFSTMIDPEIRGVERSRLITERFLFGDGPFQIVYVCALIFLAATIVSCAAGAFVTTAMVVYLLTR